MTDGWSVLAAGELITDHLFVAAPDGRSVYAGARGGGSAFNVAANLAASSSYGQGRVLAWGSGGDDTAGRLAVGDLDAAGVLTEGLTLLRRRRTRLIFERVGHGPTGTVGGTAHGFGTACPVCGQRDVPRSRPTLDAAASTLVPVPPADVLVLDRLSPARLRLAQSLRAQGTCTVLDLGAVAYLRYSPVAEVIASVRGFDLLVMSEPVERSLLARASLPGRTQFAEVAALGLLLVSRGRKGLTLVGGPPGRRGERHLAGVAGPVTDDAGAGDALLAGVVRGALERAVRAGRPVGTAFAGLDLDEAAGIADDAVGRLVEVLASDGARGHLRYRRPPNPYAELEGTDSDRLLERAHDAGVCPVCTLPLWLDADALDRRGVRTPSPPAQPWPSTLSGASDPPDIAHERSRASTAGGRRSRSAHAVDLMIRRVLHAAELEEPARQAADLLRMAGNGYVVGSGGSYAAATYIAETTRHLAAGAFLAAVRPADFLRTARPVDTVVAVSYSGGTSDLGHVLDHAARIGVGRLVLLTAAQRPPLASRLRMLSEDQLIVYGPAGARAGVRERGFVSIAATVMPVVPFVRSLHDMAGLVELADRLQADAPEVQAAHELARHAHARELLLVGGGWAGPSMTDIEGKFAEADLGPTRLDEPKDFSHGRFVSVLGPGPRERAKQPVLMVSAGGPNDYERTLGTALADDGHPVAYLQAARGDALGGLELLCRAQRFSQAYGEARGIDISRPDPPPPGSGLALYRWKARPA